MKLKSNKDWVPLLMGTVKFSPVHGSNSITRATITYTGFDLAERKVQTRSDHVKKIRGNWYVLRKIAKQTGIPVAK